MSSPQTIGLHGRTYFVAGGAGVAGEAVTSALLAAGATVAVASRSGERLKSVREALPRESRARLVTVTGDVSAQDSAPAVRDTVLDRVGALDGVIASLGGWWEGPRLTEVPYETWQKILHDNLTSHFMTARTFVPALAGRPESTYIALGGIAAHEPFPGSGPICATGAAQTMLMRTLAEEHRDDHVRFHEVQILTNVVTRHWPSDRTPAADYLTGEQLGSRITRIASPDFPRKDQLELRFPVSENESQIDRELRATR